MTEDQAQKFQRQGFPTALMNSEEAAAYLAISPITLRRLVKTGKLPHVRLRTSLRFKISDLDTWLEKNTTREYVPVPGRGFQRKAAKV